MFGVLCCMNFVFAQCWDGSRIMMQQWLHLGCSGAVAALGVIFFWGFPISDSCPVTCDDVLSVLMMKLKCLLLELSKQ